MKLTGRYVEWNSFCGCRARMEVDLERHALYTYPCSAEHALVYSKYGQSYCGYVGGENLTRKLAEMTAVWRRDINKMNELLVWKDNSVFMRPTFGKAKNGLTAYQCFWDWDTKGVSLPDDLEDPDLLADLVQAKRNREFTIDQWVETYALRDEYPIWPEEYCMHPGMTFDLFKKLFGRGPTPEILRVVLECADTETVSRWESR